MSYDRENLLRKIVEIQNITLAYQAKYIPQKRIYEIYIKERYFISYSTFNDYLGINAKLQLKELLAKKERRQQLKSQQTSLNFEQEEQ